MLNAEMRLHVTTWLQGWYITELIYSWILNVVRIITSGNKFASISMASEQYKPNIESTIFEFPYWIIGRSRLIIRYAQVYLHESYTELSPS
jgi:hypothetical protein